MKKKIFGFAAASVSILSVGALISCTNGESPVTPEEIIDDTTTEQKKAIYKLAVDSGYTGTYEDWLASIKGDSIELRLNGSNVEWKYKTATTWTTLIKLDDIKGTDGTNGVSITSIAKTATEGNVDTYTITVSDGTTSTYTVTNGAKGDTGNGIAKIEKTSSEGLVDTYTITLTDGTTTTFTVTNGVIGEAGSGIAKIEKTATDGLTDTYTITLSSGVTTNYTVTNGNGVTKIEKSSSEGLVDTYTIYLTDGTTTTFTVTNGAVGEVGNGIAKVEKSATEGLTDTYTITFTNGTTTSYTVANGNGISKVEKTATEGLTDTYTIYFTDGTSTTFDIKNGKVGNKVEFKMSSTAIMYRYEGDEEWMELADLKEIFPDPVSDSYTDGLAFLEVAGKGYYVYGYYGDATEITIPAKYEGKSVIGISSKAFANNSSITKLTIPSTVTSVAKDAFEGSDNLVVTFASDITEIGTLLMENTSIQNVLIPSTVKTVKENAFYNCTNLKNVTMEEGVEKVEQYAFKYCNKLEKMYFPKSLVTCEGEVFRDETWKTEENFNVYYNGSLEDWFAISFDQTASNPMYYAANMYLANASGDYDLLKEVTISKDVTTLNQNNLWGLFTNVEKITVEEGNTVFDSRNNCNAICDTATNTLLYACKNTVVDSTITTIGKRAFFMIKAEDKDIVIPSTVTTIESSAFRSSEFNSITISKGVQLTEYTFRYCYAKKIIDNGFVFGVNQNDYQECQAKYLETVHLSLVKEGTTNTKTFAQLIEVKYNISKTDTFKVSLVALRNAKNLEKVIFNFTDEDDTRKNALSAALYSYTTYGTDTKVSEFNITDPEEVASVAKATIGLESKYYIADLSYDRIKSEYEGFGFIEVEGDGVYVYNYTGTDTKITIPSSYNGKKVVGIWENAFKNVGNNTEVVIPASVTYIDTNAFGAHTDITLTFEEGFTKIANSYLMNNLSVVSVNIPSTVKVIEDAAFAYCTNLKHVNIAEGLEEIDSDAFKYCNSLLELYLPSTLKKVEDHAFRSDVLKTYDDFIVYYRGTFASWLEIDFADVTSIYAPSNPMIFASKLFIGTNISNYKELKEITITKDMTSLKQVNLLGLLDGAEKITVEEGNTVYDSRDDSNAIIDTATNTLLYGCKNTTISSTVTKIAGYAFLNVSFDEFEILSTITVDKQAFRSAIFNKLMIAKGVTLNSSCLNGASGDTIEFEGYVIYPNSVLAQTHFKNVITYYPVLSSAMEEMESFTLKFSDSAISSMDITSLALCPNLKTVKVDTSSTYAYFYSVDSETKKTIIYEYAKLDDEKNLASVIKSYANSNVTIYMGLVSSADVDEIENITYNYVDGEGYYVYGYYLKTLS